MYYNCDFSVQLSKIPVDTYIVKFTLTGNGNVAGLSPDDSSPWYSVNTDTSDTCIVTLDSSATVTDGQLLTLDIVNLTVAS